MRNLTTRLAKSILLKSFESLRQGYVEVACPDKTYTFGDPGSTLRATAMVHDERVFIKALLGGDIGLGEAYMNGDWSSPDLVPLIRIFVRNLALVDEESRLLTRLSRIFDWIAHRWRRNTVEGSRRNIHAHYDLSNDFFRLFLDPNMVYSCALFESEGDPLEAAQMQKLDSICRKLCLRQADHVLEIATGWGAFAIHAVRNYGCRVTTTTISREQHAYASEWVRRAGLAGRIQVLCEDYRRLQGSFDKIVSIEMFEAVGYDHYDDYFRACDRLLRPEGTMLLQTITMNEQRFTRYIRTSDWIRKYIFPGADLASVSRVLQSLAQSTRLSLFHAEEIGTHYARSLAAWRQNFQASLPAVRALGFEDRFIRMWDYYLASCEGAFRERHIGDFQLLLTKNYNPRVLFNEPWSEAPLVEAPLPVAPAEEKEVLR